MLKEVFLIKDSLLLFHYNREHSGEDSDQAVMSSGLMSAIHDFSEHTRADTLESFSTENEYFLFMACFEDKGVLVGVFERSVPPGIADRTLKRVREVLSLVDIPQGSGQVLDREKAQDLRGQIDRVNSQVFGSEEIDAYVKDLLRDRTDIPLGFVVDTEKKETLARFARPRPLYKESMKSELLLVHATLIRALQKLYLSDNYVYFRTRSDEYSAAVVQSGSLLSVAAGSMRTDTTTVLEMAAKMCYQTTVPVFPSSSSDEGVISKIKITSDGKLETILGKPLQTIAAVFFSTLFKQASELHRLLTRRNLTGIDVFAEGEPPKTLNLRKLDDGTIVANVRQYSNT